MTEPRDRPPPKPPPPDSTPRGAEPDTEPRARRVLGNGFAARESPTAKRRTVPVRRPSPGTGRPRASRYAGRYELVGLLGVGGMGSVYRVKDLTLEDEVALKILRKDFAESPVAVARFHREVKLARRINDHNVVRIFDVGECDGEHYYTMECIVGDVISTMVAAKGGLSLERTLEIAIQLTSGVIASHRAGVVHRDLKPENVLVARDGRVVITDFGVAFARDEPGTSPLPTKGAGTPLYMSPEQIEGRELDERTDLYAIGLMLYEMLTGSLPWGREPEGTSSIARLSVPAPPLKGLHGKLPDSLSSLVLRLLEREPADRPRDAATILRMLESCREELRTRAVVDAVATRSDVPLVRSPLPAIATTNMPHLRAVAVLPVRNLGASEDDYIAEALTDELTDRLVVCPGVRVASRLALSLEEGGDPRAIGRRAGVDVVIDCTVHKRQNGMLRVKVRMVEMERGFMLWSDRFERPAGDLFVLQDEIARAVARTLTVEMRAQQRDVGPENHDNVDVFLRAKKAYVEWTPAGTDQAIDLLTEALIVSPGDPLLRAYLALAQLRQWDLDPHAPASTASEAERVARKVLEKNPNLGEAHLALGIHALLEANWMVAARRLEEAVRCNPAMSDAHLALGLLQCWTNHVEQGLRMLDLALRLDPRNLRAIWSAAITMGLVGQTETAYQYLDRADFVCENHPATLSTRLRIAFWHGDRGEIARAHDDAIGADLDPGNIESTVVRLYTEPEPDREIGALTAYAASPDSPPMQRGRIMQVVAERIVMSGHVEEAWSALRAAAPHSIDALWLLRCPALVRMTRTPAFLALRTQVSQRAKAIFDAASAHPRPKT
ncbi:MAG: protein kinase [Deltaproteobacteria bacterium]|nr:protein kinase [Deltaproteobacteria bacterium]